jgi:ATP-dependent Lon protease
MILLDELDKAGGDSRFDPAAGLYSLLERETAKRFVDLSIRGLPVDASAIMWIITANDETKIPTPIRSRCLVQHIRVPTFEESVQIAKNIYISIRNSRPWGKHFVEELPDSVVEKLAVHEPRKMKALLIRALGQAAQDGRGSIGPDDLPDAPKQRPFGFLPGSTRQEDESGGEDQ